MLLHYDPPQGLYQINRYEKGKVWINEQLYHDNLLLSANQLICPWTKSNITSIKLSDLQLILDSDIEVLLMGTGEQMLLPDHDLLLPLWQKGIGVEYMQNAAACRTFTILATEQRKVALCLFLSCD